MKVIFEGTFEEWVQFLSCRDAQLDELKEELQKLRTEPLRFSRENLARKVLGETQLGLTPNQRDTLRKLIEDIAV